MTEETRRGVIITFRRKDERPDADTDKLDIVRGLVETPVRFFGAEQTSRTLGVPSGLPDELIGYDVNRFEAPIVLAHLTDREVQALRSNPNVANVEDDGEMHALPVSAPIAPQLMVEGQPDLLAETVPAGVAAVQAPPAWDFGRGMAIKVFVADTGIDDTHPDIAPNFRGGQSFVPGESSTRDYNGHGTHVAGTVGAALNGTGVVGVAPKAYLYPLKVLSRTGNGNWSWLIAALDWAIEKKGRRIFSMSLGGNAPQAVETMCQQAWDAGILLVAAAGNTGGPVGEPAAFPSVVAVSSIDDANALASSSSRGREVELCAPGVNVLSTAPGGGYRRLSGTSMACPHVSGAAAVAWSTHRYADNVTIRRLLAWTADNLGAAGRDQLFGFGRVDAHQAAADVAGPPVIPGLP